MLLASLHRWDDPSGADPCTPENLGDSLPRSRLEDMEARLVAGKEGRTHVPDRRSFARELLGGGANIAPRCANFARMRNSGTYVSTRYLGTLGSIL